MIADINFQVPVLYRTLSMGNSVSRSYNTLCPGQFYSGHIHGSRYHSKSASRRRQRRRFSGTPLQKCRNKWNYSENEMVNCFGFRQRLSETWTPEVDGSPKNKTQHIPRSLFSSFALHISSPNLPLPIDCNFRRK